MAERTVRYDPTPNQSPSVRSLLNSKGGVANEEELTIRSEESVNGAKSTPGAESKRASLSGLTLALISTQVAIAGGIYRGVQETFPNTPPLILLDHNETHSTLAVQYDPLTFSASLIRRQLASHKAYWDTCENRAAFERQFGTEEKI